jgi:hypothetical protein
MTEIYRIFSKDWEAFHDFSDEAKIELFNHESYGLPISPKNGYALGKKWLNVQVSMWLEDIENGLLFKHELYSDPKYPEWWLDGIFKNQDIRIKNWWLK